MKRLMMACLSGRRVLAQDSFDRSNGALGNADIGGAWTVSEGTFAIATNKAKATANAVRSCAVLLMPQLDYEISCDITWYTGDIAIIVARSTNANANDQIRARVSGTTILLQKIISDSGTTLGSSYSYTWSNGATHNIKLSCKGNDFIVYLDGTSVITATDDNATKTNQYAGLLASKTGAVPATLFDNLLVMG